MPLPTGLIERLQRLKEKRTASLHHLVFPNGRGRPDSEMDMAVMRVARRAKLNCGRCVSEHGNKCSQGPKLHELLPAQVPAYFCHKPPARWRRHPHRTGVAGPPRHQIDHGLPQGHPLKGCGDESQQRETGETCRHPEAHARLLELLSETGIQVDDYSSATHPMEVLRLVRDGYGMAFIRKGTRSIPL